MTLGGYPWHWDSCGLRRYPWPGGHPWHGGAVVALKGVSMDSCGLRGYPWHGGSCGLKGGINGQLWP